MRLVIIESPFAGHGHTRLHRFIARMRNISYARACVRDSLKRGEAPIASHLLYTQRGILRDEVDGERRLGIDAGLAWGKVADLTAVYTDRGTSTGMKYGIMHAQRDCRAIEYRTLSMSD